MTALPDNMIIDFKSLTIGEMVEIEDITGQPIGALGKNVNGLSAKALAAIVFIAARRQDPTFTFEDALAVDVSDVEFADVGDSSPPDEAA